MSEHIMGQADKISEKRDPGAIWDLSAAQKAASIRESAYKEGYAAGLAAGEKERKELMDGLRDARRLIEGLGLSPLELAAKYGPDYMPPDEEEIGEMYEAICTLLSRQAPAIEEEKEK